ncbi:uncharacterized protein [Ptychodera flava]|uniref:uncharacterized protein n=1 Tax=Ptychodera flava TaxID=63121 RepID=UPI003969F9AE
MDNVHRKRVPELRQFLSERGITCSNTRKDRLIQLVLLATELDVRPLEPDDHEISSKRRRTVADDRDPANAVTLPDPMAITRWSSDLHSLPAVEIADILIYLLDKCDWTRERLSNYRNDNGFLLFRDGHIIDLKIHRIANTEYIYVMSDCVRETSQREQPYRTWFLMKTNSKIISGGCNCVAEHGTCKHCVALLFSINDFDTRHKDRSTQVGTDVPCKWDKPRKESKPMEIDDIDIRKNKSELDKPKPTMSNYYPGAIRDDEEKKIFDMKLAKEMYEIADDDSCWKRMLDPLPAVDVQKPKTVLQIGNSFNAYNDGNFISYLSESVTKADIDFISTLTSDQRDCEDWFLYRQGRITASIAHDILHMKETQDLNNYIVQKIMSGSHRAIPSTHIDFGIKHEPVAKHLYYEQYKALHKKVNFEDVGLIISSDKPYLSSSPDGRVSCACCGTGLCEIKCSSKHRNIFPCDIPNIDPKYHVYLDVDGKVCLRKSSKWYTQIQVQLATCKLQWCDFVLFTRKSISIERIHFDETFWKTTEVKLTTFYKNFIVPNVLS